MSNIQVKINYEGVGTLLKSEEVKDFLQKEAAKRASSIGSGYAVDTYTAGTRNIASIYTETDEAARDNLRNNTLLKAVST